MREAYAWSQNRLVGRFFEDSDGVTRLEYAPGAFAPISLSLPLDGSWRVDAPGAFLDGLLPDNDGEREAMRRWFGAVSADPLDLLVGGGCDGRTVLHVGSRAGRNHVPGSRVRKEKDVAIKVYRLGRGWTTWQSDDRRSRFALCGFAGQIRLGAVRRPLDLAERQAPFDPHREAAP